VLVKSDTDYPKSEAPASGRTRRRIWNKRSARIPSAHRGSGVPPVRHARRLWTQIFPAGPPRHAVAAILPSRAKGDLADLAFERSPGSRRPLPWLVEPRC
jgi:hypothetical protein